MNIQGIKDPIHLAALFLAEMNHAIAQMHLSAAAAHCAPTGLGSQHLQEGYGWSGVYEEKKAELEALIAESNPEGQSE